MCSGTSVKWSTVTSRLPWYKSCLCHALYCPLECFLNTVVTGYICQPNILQTNMCYMLSVTSQGCVWHRTSSGKEKLVAPHKSPLCMAQHITMLWLLLTVTPGYIMLFGYLAAVSYLSWCCVLCWLHFGDGNWLGHSQKIVSRTGWAT